jgi:hypothetical protein
MSSDVHYGKHMVVVSDRGFGMDMVIGTIRAARAIMFGYLVELVNQRTEKTAWSPFILAAFLEDFHGSYFLPTLWRP